MQPEITPNSEKCAWRRLLFFLQNLVRAALASLNPFHFSFVSVHFRFTLFPVGAASRFPGALKSLPAIGMKHHSLSLTWGQQSRKERFFTQPRAKLLFIFNVYQNSSREETDRELRVKQFDTEEKQGPGIPDDCTEASHSGAFQWLYWPSSWNVDVVMRGMSTVF